MLDKTGADLSLQTDCFNCFQLSSYDNRELKQTDAAAAILQISIQKDSRPNEFSRPLTSITLNLNGICLLTAAASVCLSSLMSVKKFSFILKTEKIFRQSLPAHVKEHDVSLFWLLLRDMPSTS